eukprot:529096-Hanusia_phi.AAC.1
MSNWKDRDQSDNYAIKTFAMSLLHVRFPCSSSSPSPSCSMSDSMFSQDLPPSSVLLTKGDLTVYPIRCFSSSLRVPNEQQVPTGLPPPPPRPCHHGSGPSPLHLLPLLHDEAAGDDGLRLVHSPGTEAISSRLLPPGPTASPGDSSAPRTCSSACSSHTAV